MNLLDIFNNLTLKDKNKILLEDRTLIEKLHIEKYGGIHFTNNSGPDGIKGKKYLEVKSQCKVGKTKLNGTFIFNDPTENLLSTHIKNNDTIIVVGYNSSGKLMYEFSIDFKDITKEYKYMLSNNYSSTFNFKIMDFANKESFKNIFTTDFDTLKLNRKEFDINFYNRIYEIYETKLDDTW